MEDRGRMVANMRKRRSLLRAWGAWKEEFDDTVRSAECASWRDAKLKTEGLSAFKVCLERRRVRSAGARRRR